MPRIRPISYFISSTITNRNPESAPSITTFTLDAFHHTKKHDRRPLIVTASQLPITLQQIHDHLDKFSASPSRTLLLLGDIVPETPITEQGLIDIINNESNVAGGSKEAIEVTVYDKPIEEYGGTLDDQAQSLQPSVGKDGKRAKHIPLQVQQGPEEGGGGVLHDQQQMPGKKEGQSSGLMTVQQGSGERQHGTQKAKKEGDGCKGCGCTIL